MRELTLRAPAKLNLFLLVLNRRTDGYHSIFTLFQKISLWDDIGLSIRPGGRGVELECLGARLPTGPENLAYDAARCFLDETGLDFRVRVHLRKAIPVGGGLGGGSSDAAAVLKGLNRLTGEPLSGEVLHILACRLGADVPFFLMDAPAAFGCGTGTDLERVVLPGFSFVLICPDFGISTRWAYQKCELTSRGQSTIFDPGEALQAASWRNDLERAVLQRHPEIARAKVCLRELGAEVALMSGSGSTVFGVFFSEAAAARAARELQVVHGLRAFTARSLT